MNAVRVEYRPEADQSPLWLADRWMPLQALLAALSGAVTVVSP